MRRPTRSWSPQAGRPQHQNIETKCYICVISQQPGDTTRPHQPTLLVSEDGGFAMCLHSQLGCECSRIIIIISSSSTSAASGAPPVPDPRARANTRLRPVWRARSRCRRAVRGRVPAVAIQHRRASRPGTVGDRSRDGFLREPRGRQAREQQQPSVRALKTLRASRTRGRRREWVRSVQSDLRTGRTGSSDRSRSTSDTLSRPRGAAAGRDEPRAGARQPG